MVKIDAHHHLWRYNSRKHAWITDQMSALRRNFLPTDLRPLMRRAGYTGSVAVQASQTEEETRFLIEQANAHQFICGVVGWLDLCSAQLEDRLNTYTRDPVLKGLRHVLQDEQDDRFMLRPDFMRGIDLLGAFGLRYDILVYPRHLPMVRELVKTFPGQQFVIDHMAKPPIRSGSINPWKRHLEEIAKCENVYCKISGLVTEADRYSWTARDLKPYLDAVCNIFGEDRLMIGSDWPVCTLAGDYGQIMSAVETALPTNIDRVKVLGKNAMRFYDLPSPESHAERPG